MKCQNELNQLSNEKNSLSAFNESSNRAVQCKTFFVSLEVLTKNEL
jgi:hypothetical protein